MTLDELKRFCAKNDARDYLNSPMSDSEYTYASNGYICVRIPRVKSQPISDHKFLNSARSLFELQYDSWVPVPAVAMPEKEECKECHGSGIHECMCGHEHDCIDCDGDGKVMPKHKPIKIGDSFFGDQLLLLIQGWEISVPSGMGPAGIRGEGAEGRLMPRREK